MRPGADLDGAPRNLRRPQGDENELIPQNPTGRGWDGVGSRQQERGVRPAARKSGTGDGSGGGIEASAAPWWTHRGRGARADRSGIVGYARSWEKGAGKGGGEEERGGARASSGVDGEKAGQRRRARIPNLLLVMRHFARNLLSNTVPYTLCSKLLVDWRFS